VFLAREVNVKRNWIVHDLMLLKWHWLCREGRDACYDCDPAVSSDGDAEFSNRLSGGLGNGPGIGIGREGSQGVLSIHEDTTETSSS